MYNKAQAQDSQHQLIERYAPLVKRIAYHLLARLPASVQVDDLIQAGMIGLLEASRKYDSSKGASFETFAGIRIRGAMLDEVRKGDWAPRSVHRNSRMVSDAIRVVEARTGRDAKDHEVAAELQLSLEDYYGILGDTLGSRLFSFDDSCRTASTAGCTKTPGTPTSNLRGTSKTNASRRLWPMPSLVCRSVNVSCWRCITTKN
jgi:RNA polymerase sigma factor for flagellar operon FliA